MIIILTFLIGLLLGLFRYKLMRKDYNNILNKQEKLLKTQDEAVEFYQDCYSELYNMYNEALNGIDELVAENIALKKKLKAYE